MPEQGRKSDGKFESKVSDEDILAVLEASATPGLTTSLVAEELPVTSKAVYSRLRKLYDEIRVGQIIVGAREVVWWVADESE